MSRPLAAVSMTPNWFAWSIGTRIPATVTPTPLATCWATIWRGSMR